MPKITDSFKCEGLKRGIPYRQCLANQKDKKHFCKGCMPGMENAETFRDEAIGIGLAGHAAEEKRVCASPGCRKEPYSERAKFCKEHKPEKSLCEIPGCGKARIKGRLCYSCFKEKHGEPPYGPKAKKPRKKVEDRAFNEAISGLMNLGFKKRDARQALEEARTKGCEGVEGLLNGALKALSCEEGVLADPSRLPALVPREAEYPTGAVMDPRARGILGQLMVVQAELDSEAEAIVERGTYDIAKILRIRRRLGLLVQSSLRGGAVQEETVVQG